MFISSLVSNKTLVRPVVMYAAETWTLLNSDTHNLRVSERRILRKIFGSVKGNEEWRIWNNRELIDDDDIVRFIRSTRIRWLGLVMRMEE